MTLRALLSPTPLIALLVFGTVPAAHAVRALDLHANSAGELAKLCVANPRDGRGDAEINFCHGFGQGLIDTVRHFEPKAFCFPKPTPTRSETMAQFAHWVQADPKHAQLPADAAMYTYLKERYPCGG